MCIQEIMPPIGCNRKIKMNNSNKAKLELLRELTNATLENGRTQWNNRSILSWVDSQKEIINKEIK